jgi:F-type H+-transporting ATPase subunit delta
LTTKKIVDVYASVLLEGSKAQDDVFDVAGELQAVLESARSSVKLNDALNDAGIPVETKIDLLKQLYPGLSSVVVVALKLMFERAEFKLLAKVRDVYADMAEKALGAQFVDVTTAVGMDAATRKQLSDKYSAQLGCDILIREHVDPKLIGGIVISTHGRVLDASVSAQLNRAQRVLASVSGGEA